MIRDTPCTGGNKYSRPPSASRPCLASSHAGSNHGVVQYGDDDDGNSLHGKLGTSPGPIHPSCKVPSGKEGTLAGFIGRHSVSYRRLKLEFAGGRPLSPQLCTQYHTENPTGAPSEAYFRSDHYHGSPQMFYAHRPPKNKKDSIALPAPKDTDAMHMQLPVSTYKQLTSIKEIQVRPDPSDGFRRPSRPCS